MKIMGKYGGFPGEYQECDFGLSDDYVSPRESYDSGSAYDRVSRNRWKRFAREHRGQVDESGAIW